jgi:hypothetical protein
MNPFPFLNNFRSRAVQIGFGKFQRLGVDFVFQQEGSIDQGEAPVEASFRLRLEADAAFRLT